ncbi:cell wall hydrolase [Pseudomonas sp. PDM24]|uniref:cell wall hydrolase n=1 Tax=Pseudomonas sp. PDM24 TaxID=2854777 RepID=UPI001C496725|nr:cell wall hydrolase [Pseudomonas sp. PDM24]MBV7492974.1 cell wall hydrolase [Pseudomonas sp. PDM24]
MTATEIDRDIFARTLWGEARGEGLAGQIAVAWTIRNRVNDGKARSWWGEGYVGVCQKPYQFSCWNKNDPNFVYLSGAKPIPFREFAQAQIAAEQVMTGKVPDPTGGATHYYATTLPKAPAWTVGAKQTFRLGHHVFFRDVP